MHRRSQFVDNPQATVSEVIRSTAERWPRLYLAVARRRTPNRLLVDDTTDVVVEGFPRSGNTFLRAWLESANPGLRVASHAHSVAHVREALRRGVPVVVALREPEGALASAMVRSDVLGLELTVEQLAARYTRFHRGLMGLLDDLIVSPFATTTERPELVVAALRRTGVELASAPPGGESAALQMVERMGKEHLGHVDERVISRPSAQRAELVDAARRRLREDYSDTLARLRDIHDVLEGSSAAVRP